MVGQLIYLQDSLLEGIFLLSIAPEFIRGYLSHKIETHPIKVSMPSEKRWLTRRAGC